MLAVSPPNVLDAILDAGLAPRTSFTITNPSVLKRQLATVARAGVAYEREESGLGVTCAASPVYGYSRQVVAAISITGPVGRLRPERYASAVHLAALALSRLLGSPSATQAASGSRPAARPRREARASNGINT
jgi:DNA-binding IclR family transcriptional regulator